MTVRVSKNNGWFDPNFEPSAGPARDFDNFAPVDLRGTGLRAFVEKQLQAQSATSSGSGSSEVLVRGKIFLRQLPHGEYELLVSRGRNTYDQYFADTREELILFAESLEEEK